jgi:putative transcriptional regulator
MIDIDTIEATDLLIAPPRMVDPVFAQSVLMVTQATERQHVALCLNRPSEYTVRELGHKVGVDIDSDEPLYWGGPVSASTIWLVHSSEWQSDNTCKLNQHLSMTSSNQMFLQIGQRHLPRHWRFVFGYACWSPGQLAGEIAGMPPWNRRHSWLTAELPLAATWIFDTAIADMWPQAAELSGRQAVRSWL